MVKVWCWSSSRCKSRIIFGRPFVKRFALCYDRCLSVCLYCLSVTLVYCDQTVGLIKMKLGLQVGLGPVHVVLDGDPAKGGGASKFSAHIYCSQTAGWIKMPLHMHGVRPQPRRPSPPSQKGMGPGEGYIFAYLYIFCIFLHQFRTFRLPT